MNSRFRVEMDFTLFNLYRSVLNCRTAFIWLFAWVLFLTLLPRLSNSQPRNGHDWIPSANKNAYIQSDIDIGFASGTYTDIAAPRILRATAYSVLPATQTAWASEAIQTGDIVNLIEQDESGRDRLIPYELIGSGTSLQWKRWPSGLQNTLASNLIITATDQTDIGSNAYTFILPSWDVLNTLFYRRNIKTVTLELGPDIDLSKWAWRLPGAVSGGNRPSHRGVMVQLADGNTFSQSWQVRIIMELQGVSGGTDLSEIAVTDRVAGLGLGSRSFVRILHRRQQR